MIIAVDVDEVLANFMEDALVLFNKEEKTNWKRNQFTNYDLSKIFNETHQQTMDRIHRFYMHKSFASIKPIPNSQEAIFQLAKNHKLIALTSRPSIIEKQTKEWLKKNFGNSIKEIRMTNQWNNDGGNSTTKAKICAEIKAKILIEDSSSYLIECLNNNNQMYGIMPNCPWNKNEPNHKRIFRVNSWKEIPALVDKISKI